MLLNQLSNYPLDMEFFIVINNFATLSHLVRVLCSILCTVGVVWEYVLWICVYVCMYGCAVGCLLWLLWGEFVRYLGHNLIATSCFYNNNNSNGGTLITNNHFLFPLSHILHSINNRTSIYLC